MSISIKIGKNTCTYTVENSKFISQKEGEKSGIGLQNVRRRLELSYPEHYTLVEEDRGDSYYVQLKLNLQ